jgi:sarcosine oxidase, subunit gamma
MAETLTATSLLAGFSERFAQLPPTVKLSEEPFVAMVDLRVDPDGPAASRASAILGLELPTTPSTYVRIATLTAIWMGPDEWLITAGTRSAATLETELRTAVSEDGGAAIDVSAQRTTLRLSGPDARDVLAKGCSLDLHPRMFRKGTAAQTMLGLAVVVLIALDDDGTDYGILVRSSFARYLADWLIDAAEEFGVLR